MPDAAVADAIEKWGSVIIVGAIVGVGTLIPQLLERRKKQDRSNVLTRIEGKIDANHAEVQEELHRVTVYVDAVSKVATDALHAAVGINGENGNRGEIRRVEERLNKIIEKRLNDIEQWQENDTMRERERLQRIADAAVIGLPNPSR